MDGGTVFIVVVVGAVVLVGVLVGMLRMRKDRRRSEEYAAWAAGRGWEYREEDPDLARDLVGPAFERGRQHRAVHVARGPVGGRPATVADFHYVTTSRGGRDGEVDVDKVHRLSVVALDLGVLVPDLVVEPQGAAGRIRAKVSGGAVEVGDPAFDRAFKVTADEAVARHLLTPQVRQFAGQHPHAAWSLQGRLLTTWREGEQSPAEAEQTLAFLDALARTLPH